MKRKNPPALLLTSNNVYGENLTEIHDCSTSHRYNTSHDEICVHSAQQEDTEQSCCTDKKGKLHSDCNMTPSDDPLSALPNTNEDGNVIELE